jgi:hypothetical protein
VIVARARIVALALLPLLLVGAPAQAKTYKYQGGPKPPADTVLSVAQTDIELVARRAMDQALASAPLDSGAHVLVAPSESHPLNFMVEHAVLLHLARRGVTATVRRSIIPDDSLVAIAGNPGDPVLEYSLASARVTYLRLVGWLPGRVRIERQGLVQGTLTLRDPLNSRVLWTGEASGNLVDRFPKGQLPLVEDQRYADLKSPAPVRNVDKVFEPIVVVAVVVGLVALFFQNRP